jgi:hypothetical protein
LGVRGRLADSEDPKEIETTPLSGKTAKPDWKRRFIRGASRGCKVRRQTGFIIDPAVDGESGKPEEASTAALKNRDPGRTGNQFLSTCEGPKRQGELEPGPSEESEVKEESG